MPNRKKKNFSSSLMNTLIKSVLILGVFGFIPGAWTVELPVILGYGLFKAYIHRSSIKRAIKRRLQKTIRDFLPEITDSDSEPEEEYTRSLIEKIGTVVGRIFKKYGFTMAKGLTSFVLLFTLPLPWGLLALYGLYRYPDRQLKKRLFKTLSSGYDFVMGFFHGSTHELSYNQILIRILVISFLLVSGIYFSGELFLIDLALTILQSMVVWLGLTSAMKDISQALKTPLSAISNNIGKMCGLFFGRYFAYHFLTGRVTGSLGPAIGQVHSSGFLSEILSPLFNPSGLRFSNMSLLGRFLSSDFAHLINGAFNDVFFSHSMQLSGDFYGAIGPTHFQIFLLMGVGCLIGYAVEKSISAFCKGITKDCEKIKIHNKTLTTHLSHLLYQGRWQIAFAIGATPFILFSSLGTPILVLAGGSVAGAALLTFLGVSVGVGMLYLVGTALASLTQSPTPHNDFCERKTKISSPTRLYIAKNKTLTHHFRQSRLQKQQNKKQPDMSYEPIQKKYLKLT